MRLLETRQGKRYSTFKVRLYNIAVKRKVLILLFETGFSNGYNSRGLKIINNVKKLKQVRSNKCYTFIWSCYFLLLQLKKNNGKI